MNKKISKIILFFTLFNTAPLLTQEALLEHWNQRIDKEGVLNGQFEVNQGNIIYNGTNPPSWAVDHQLDALGINKGYGTGGINPFKFYTHEEWRESALGHYFPLRGFGRDGWLIDGGGDGVRSGVTLLEEAKRKLGADVFKDMHEHQLRVAARNEFWDSLQEKVIPTIVDIFKQPKVIGLVAIFILLLIGIPLLIWNGTKAIFAWIFVRRPTILGPKDSDIYQNWFKRLFWKYPKLPKVTVNENLEKQLSSLIETNKKITQKNKGGLFRDPEKTPYPHIIAYGEAGVGKTLFAKNLAKESGMHFMYLTVSDLSQLAEEEAIETLKNFFLYARKYAPCVLIIDEADRLFAGEDVKSKKLATLFQREFSKAVDENIQLFFITNYPWKFPAPILNRMSKVLYFDVPDYSTKLKLFAQHLKIALKRQGKNYDFENLEFILDEDLVEGLVGRDIESISIAYSLRQEQSSEVLKREIAEYKQGKENMKAFKDASEQKPPSPKSNKKTTKKKRFFEL